MSDRPIIFSAPMIRALLDGRKTQTRRVLKLPTKTHSGGPIYERSDKGGWAATTIGGHGCFTIGADGNRVPAPERPAIWHQTTGVTMAPPYAVGDRLWVREAACWVSAWGWRYRADNDDLTEKRESGEVGKWRPSIHMPRTASRLTLAVTDVRVQRLQEIGADDAVAEGCHFKRWITGEYPFFDQGVEADNHQLVRMYRDLWNSLHGPDAWDANPWVVAISFTVQRGNIDQIGGDA